MTAYFNFYQRFSTSPMATTSNDRHGSIRPLMSSSRRAPAPAFDPTPMTVAERINHVRQHLFMEDQKFQVIGSGIDGIYGGMLSQELRPLRHSSSRLRPTLSFQVGVLTTPILQDHQAVGRPFILACFVGRQVLLIMTNT